MLEVIDDKVYNLLDKSQKTKERKVLKMLDDKDKITYVHNLNGQYDLVKEEHFKYIMDLGDKNRATQATKNN